MITYNEWQQTLQDTSLVANQIEQLVDRLAGLLHPLTEEDKSELVDQFMRSVEKRVLGL